MLASRPAALAALREDLLPALSELEGALRSKSVEFWPIIKTGRTHLQDATPIRLGQEFLGYAGQIERAQKRLGRGEEDLLEVALGGTAVGTGINAPAQFDVTAARYIADETNRPFVDRGNKFVLLSAHDGIVTLSAALRTLACALFKIANDVRWYASGPRAGIGELSLPVVLSGPEVVYRVHIRSRVANFGVAIVSRSRGVSVEPRIVRSADENRLAGLTAFPYDANPYRPSEGHHRLIVGVLQPSPGAYDVVFDTPARGRTGRFVFRLWQDDTTPPGVHVLGIRGRALELRVTDQGSGVDPASLAAKVDGSERSLSYASGVARNSLTGLARGRHTLVFSAAEYQEAKNDLARRDIASDAARPGGRIPGRRPRIHRAR